MKEKKGIPYYIFNSFFFAAVVICFMITIYASIIFINNCNYNASNTKKLTEYFISVAASAADPTESPSVSQNPDKNLVNKETETPDLQQMYNEHLLEYAERLQELENNSKSTNLMAFLYTFISGTLIGIATYFTKKSADSVKQINKNSELISNLNSQILFSNFYMHARQLYSTIQIFSVPLDAIHDAKILEDYIQKNIVQVSELIMSFRKYANNNKDSVTVLNADQTNSLKTEISQVQNMAQTMGDKKILPDLTGPASKIWIEQLEDIKTILKAPKM